MSLINDALKQARSAQPNAPATADGPMLRPDFSARRSHMGNSLLLPALIVVILLLAASLLMQWFRSGEAAPVVVHARSVPDASSVPSAPSPQPAATLAAVAPTPASTAPEKTSNAPVVAPAPASSVSSATNVPIAVAAPAPPPKPAYKLQSLFYRRNNPSAVINGKTVYVGDRVGDAHVIAIDKDSVTILTGKGETKVLDSPD